MPSFDVTSELDWHELDNAVHQLEREITTRFDFKGVKTQIEVEKKNNRLVMNCSVGEKMDSLVDMFQTKLVKRGLSLLAFQFGKVEPATGQSVRQEVTVEAGVSKEKGKKIVKLLKDAKIKVQAQIQDEQVRVTGKKRDDLQSAIQFLKDKQSEIELPLNFGNFRD